MKSAGLSDAPWPSRSKVATRKCSRNQGVAIGGPQFGILRQPVHQHIGRPALGTVELVADPVGAVGEEGHRGDPAGILIVHILARATRIPLS